MPNFVIIMTDTQNTEMVGAYGFPQVDTPNLDRLAADGIRFERAYTSCPLCTPARAGLFSGLHPQVAGAWCNNIAPHRHVALMGDIFRHYGYRAAYTGKWHLDGSAYFGDGQPGGGFEPDWWYDGKRYADDLGTEKFARYRAAQTEDFAEDEYWGHRVASRAIDFLRAAGGDPFLLVCSFDEPHGPSAAPPAYREQFTPADIPRPPNYNAPLGDKPALHHVQRRQRGEIPWEQTADWQCRFFGCNSYIDREIGRVVEAVEELHGDDTVIIYTSDHGDQRGAHGLWSKGPMMYEETCNIPFIVRMPDGPRGAVSRALVSHVDAIPTLLDLAGIDAPEVLHGASFAPVLRDPSVSARETALVSFTRFAVNHDSFGEFYPVRCLIDGRHKLIVNLFETDELYDLHEDPGETRNVLHEPACAAVRDDLHDRLLAEMDRIRDPFRSFRWGHRDWRRVREAFYTGGQRRDRPRGFPFQPTSIDG